jgi:hypothetical protein
MATTEATRPAFWVQPAPAISNWQLAISKTDLKTNTNSQTSVPQCLRGRVSIGGRP